ncbi:MAG: HAMP domain-containing sensor histidine kinase [Pseudomonadota bacterium]
MARTTLSGFFPHLAALAARFGSPRALSEATGALVVLWSAGAATLLIRVFAETGAFAPIGLLLAGLFAAAGAAGMFAALCERPWSRPFAISVVSLSAALATAVTVNGQSAFFAFLAAPFAIAAAFGCRARTMAAAVAAPIALTVVMIVFATPPSISVQPEMAAMVAVLSGVVTALLCAGVAGVVHRRRIADREALAQKARAVLALNAAADAIVRHGGDGLILEASRAAAAVFDVEARELAGRSLIAFAAPEDRRRVRSALARAAYLGQTMSVDFRLDGDGPERWIETRIARAPGAAADAALISISRDVTDRVAREAALIAARDAAEAAAEQKARFLADMSHELRTPLNAIIGFSDMMTMETFGPLGDEKYAEYATLIRESGAHLLDLVSDILDMSKIEADKYALTLDTVDVCAVVRSCVELTRVTAGRAGVSLSAEMAADAPEVRADARAVKQIVLNLLSNAIKFTPAGGSVSVMAETDDAGVLLTVSDTGVGIAAKDLQRLGERFEQAPKTGDNEVRGSGLGLALVRALAALHGGAMEIESAVGEGTRVSVRLPHDPEAAGDPGTVVIRDVSTDAPSSVVHGHMRRIETLQEELSERRGAA